MKIFFFFVLEFVFEARARETDAPPRNLRATSQITCVNVIIPAHLRASRSPRDPVWAAGAERRRQTGGLGLLLVGFFIHYIQHFPVLRHSLSDACRLI